MPAAAQRWQPGGRRGRSATYSGRGELSHPKACCPRIWGCRAENSLTLQLEECWESWQGCKAGHQQINQITNKNKSLFCISRLRRRVPETRVVGCGESLVWLLREDGSGHRGLVLLPWAAHGKTHPGTGRRGSSQSHAKAAPRKIFGRTYGVVLNAPITFI